MAGVRPGGQGARVAAGQYGQARADLAGWRGQLRGLLAREPSIWTGLAGHTFLAAAEQALASATPLLLVLDDAQATLAGFAHTLDVQAAAARVASPGRADADAAGRRAEAHAVAALTALVGALAATGARGRPGAAQNAVIAALAHHNAKRADTSLRTLNPSAVRALFADLSPGAALELARLDPALVGNLDGATFTARAAANRMLIRRAIAAARSAGDRAGVEHLQALLAHGGQVVLYDPERGRYAVMYGDADTATHLAITIPGVDSNTHVPHCAADARALFAQAGPGSAVIMWKGYDAPGWPQAPATGPAEQGAPLLTAFVGGMPRPAGQSLTLVAHSYGSVVAGVALARFGLKTDRLVVLGSPGMEVDDTRGLHLRPDQTFAEQAPWDYVVEGLGGFGTLPSAVNFGARRMTTNAPGAPAVRGHDEYFTPGSRALQNTAEVVDGDIAAVQRQASTTGDIVAGNTAQLLRERTGRGVLDRAERTYHGPGSGALQVADHIAIGVSNDAGNVAGDTISGAAVVGKMVVDDLTRPRLPFG